MLALVIDELEMYASKQLCLKEKNITYVTKFIKIKT